MPASRTCCAGLASQLNSFCCAYPKVVRRGQTAAHFANPAGFSVLSSNSRKAQNFAGQSQESLAPGLPRRYPVTSRTRPPGVTLRAGTTMLKGQISKFRGIDVLWLVFLA